MKVKEMKAKVVNPEKYFELTGKKKKIGEQVSHPLEEIQYLSQQNCIELTPLQAKMLERKKLKEETKTKGEELSEQALNYLTDKDLLKKLITEVSKSVAGEKETILVIGLNACGRLVENASKTSYNIIPNDESGVGKDYTTERTLKVFVPEDLLTIRTRLSPKVINYWHNPHFEPDWTWDGKVLFLKDVSDEMLNCEVMKTFTSDETTATILINQMAIDLKTEGKPCVFCTTANSTPNREALRRFGLLQLDSSDEQTKRIKNFHAERARNGKKEQKNTELIQAISALKRVKIVIPYAGVLVDYFPNKIIARTVFNSFLDLIRACAALHQFQRKKTKNAEVIANLHDYLFAQLAFEKQNANHDLMPVTKNQKKILEIIDKELDRNIGETLVKNHEFWTAKEISEKITFISEYKNIWSNLLALCESGFLERGDKETITSSTATESGQRNYTKSATAFRLKDKEPMELPSVLDLKNKIKETLPNSDINDIDDINNIDDINDNQSFGDIFC